MENAYSAVFQRREAELAHSVTVPSTVVRGNGGTTPHSHLTHLADEEVEGFNNALTTAETAVDDAVGDGGQQAPELEGAKNSTPV